MKKTLFVLIGFWSACVVYYAYTRFLSTSMGALSVPLSQQGFSEMTLSIAVSAYSLALLIMKFPVSFLIERFGILRPVQCAVPIVLTGVLFMSWPMHPTLLIIGRFIIGIGASFALIVTYKATSHLVSVASFTLWTGVIYFIGTGGMALSGGPLAGLLSIMHYHMTMLLIVVAGLLIWSGILLTSRSRFVQTTMKQQTNSTHAYLKGVKYLFQDKQSLLAIIYTAMMTAAFFTVISFWGSEFLRQAKHLSPHQSSFIANSILAFGSGAFSLLVGIIIYLGWIRRWQLILMSFLSTLALIALFLTPIKNLWILYSLAIVISFGFALTGIVFDTINKRCYPILATAIALLFFIENILNTLLSPLISAFRHSIESLTNDSLLSYQLAFSLIIVLYGIATVISCFIHPQRHQLPIDAILGTDQGPADK